VVVINYNLYLQSLLILATSSYLFQAAESGDSFFKAVLWIRIRIDFSQQDPDPDTGGQKLLA